MTRRVLSADGTPIAFDRLGEGEPLIVVGGATRDRAGMRPLAEQLSRHLSVFSYDRRGRGESGDTAPYAVEREIEDLAALIAEAGGTASVYGHSSGAGLALQAAAEGLPIANLVLHEAPFSPDHEEERRQAREYAAQLRTLLSEGRRGDALALFMTITGMPPEAVEQMRGEPWWPGKEAIAHTLAYDSEVMGDASRGGTVPVEVAGRVHARTLVLSGGASPDWMIEIGGRLADAVPDGTHRVLEGQEHVVAPEVLTPVLMEFLDGARAPDRA